MILYNMQIWLNVTSFLNIFINPTHGQLTINTFKNVQSHRRKAKTNKQHENVKKIVLELLKSIFHRFKIPRIQKIAEQRAKELAYC